jgi:hypothetical protein
MRAGKQGAGRAISVPYGLDGDPVAVATVQRIYAEFCHPYAHATLSEIARGLNTDEVATQRGGRWHASSVRYILCNPAYVPEVINAELFEQAAARLARLRPGPPK